MLVQHFQRIGHGSQPRQHFFLFRTRQKANALRDFRRIAGNNDALVDPPLNHQLQRGRHRQQGLTATRRAGQDHQIQRRIQQCIQCHALIDILRMHTPRMPVHQPVMSNILDQQGTIFPFMDPSGKGFSLIDQILVDMGTLQHFLINTVEHIPAMRNRFALPDLIPEGAFDFLKALGQ